MINIMHKQVGAAVIAFGMDGDGKDEIGEIV